MDHTELAPELLAQAQTIRTEAVIEAQADPPAGSPLRAMNTLFAKMLARFETAKLPPELFPVNLTIGSLEPRSYGHTADGQVDPEEQEFADLASELANDPFSNQFASIFQNVQKIARDEWLDRDKEPLTGYDSQAQGREETRQQYLKSLEGLGFKNMEVDGAFLCNGGLDGMIRTVRSLVDMSYAKFYQEHESLQAFATQIISNLPGFLGLFMKMIGRKNINTIITALTENLSLKPLVECGFPVPGFTVVAQAVKAEGAQPVYLETAEDKRFEFPAEDIETVLESHPHMDILIFTPGQNPTTEVMNPENLKNLMVNALNAKPDIKFVFDGAYFELVDPAIARQLVQAIYDNGGFANCAFVFSRSKAEGQPRMRGGLIYVPGPDIRKAVKGDTMRGFPSFSWITDVYMQALDAYFANHQDVLPRFRAMLIKRQNTLLAVLKKIDAQKPGAIFTDLANVTVGGVPLYLFTNLTEDLTAWDLVEQYGIVAAPGEAFGGKPNQVRFALGTHSCSDIKQLLNIIR